ncbi:MAG: hypothetical protein LC779_02470 [Actinobacteria bacterium]|nr:hypothetical protein [Actinomycetota bacterium]
MTRLERLALLGFFLLIIAGLATQAAGSTAVGAVGGLVAGLLLVPRLGRLRTRIDARLGADEAPRGFRPRRVGVRIGLHPTPLGVAAHRRPTKHPAAPRAA